MSETLNPISSFEYPTDEQFTELREVGQDLLKKDKQKQIGPIFRVPVEK